MKRPVTSLCRRPGKKTACGQSVPGAGTISARRDALWRSIGAAGQKPPGRGRKNSPGRGRGLCAGCAHGRAAGNGRCLVPGSITLGTRWGRGHARAQKQPPAGPEAVRRLRPWESGRQWGVWCREAPHWAHTGAEGTPGRKNSPRRGPGTVHRPRPRGNGRQWGCLVPGKHRTGRTPGQRVRPGAKQPPAEAGGCLDAGYGCYLPRAIRVIWMHRVGSTARPRIMPS